MANTGTKVVLTLRKYVDGVATGETKINSPGDPDYIAPYQDLVDCPISGDQTTAAPTAAPTASPTAAPTVAPTLAPTTEPVGESPTCKFVFVADTVDTTGYGLRYNRDGVIDTLFSSILGTTTNYNGTDGVVFSVCSTITPIYWEQSSNTTLVFPAGVEFIGSGNVCVDNNDGCEYIAP